MNPTEDYISKINSSIFFREFTYSKNDFKPGNNTEIELADNIVWIDDLLFIFQIKDRNVGKSTDKTDEKWFDNSVLKKATRQIKDTIEYLKSYDEIFVTNERGHRVNLALAPYSNVKKIIIYTPSDKLPESKRFIKFYESRDAGLIHIFHSEDYLWICKYLITPKEIEEYLSFREEIFKVDSVLMNNFPEEYVLGYFLSGERAEKINSKYVTLLTKLKTDINEFDLSGIIENFSKHIEDSSYYSIIKEIAKLKREELKSVKQRLQKIMDECKIENSHRPYRVAFPSTGCGFIFIPLNKKFTENWKRVLTNWTLAHKYDQKLKKCIGVIATEIPHKQINLIWLYVENDWIYEKQVEEWIKDLRWGSVSLTKSNRYKF